MSLTAVYDDTLSRVRVTYHDEAVMLPGHNYVLTVDRSVNQARWTQIRGGSIANPSPTLDVRADDYEFSPNVTNYYRVTLTDTGTSAVVFQNTVTVIPDMTSVWLKSATRPFLNCPVAVVDLGTVTRPARGNTFQVLGRRLPVTVSGIRGSLSFDLTVLTDDEGVRSALGTLLDTGDPLLVHVPVACPIPIPSVYVVVGDVNDDRPARLTSVHTLTLPMTEVAPPGPDVIGATVEWAGIKAQFSTWIDLQVAANTWGDVLQLIGTPDDVVVG